MRPHVARRNHGLWAGPLITILGFVGYFTVFPWWPATRDWPWAPLLIMSGGLVWAGFGLKRAWRKGGWRIGIGLFGTLLSVAVTGLLLWYCFVLSYGMPALGAPTSVGAVVPALRTIDHRSRSVDLRAASAGKLVLIFYRGHW